MKGWLRRIRGAVGMGLTWALGWAPLGVIWSLLPFVSPPSAAVSLVLGVQYALMGFVGGTCFSLVLGVLGRRRRLDEMSLLRFAAWGALGGILMNVASQHGRGHRAARGGHSRATVRAGERYLRKHYDPACGRIGRGLPRASAESGRPSLVRGR